MVPRKVPFQHFDPHRDHAMNEPTTTSPQESIYSAPATPGPSMSTANTLTGIFLEPGRTFEALRERPRFLVAAGIILVALGLFNFLAIQRVGYDNLIRASIEANPRLTNMSAEQKEQIIESQSSGFFRVLNSSVPVLIFVVSLFAGSAMYLFGAVLAGKNLNYHQSLSVWTYSSLPPTLLLMIANMIVLFLKSPGDIDFGGSASGLVHANLGLLVNARTSPVLRTALASIDLFVIYGLFLATLGISKVTRSTAGTASMIVLVTWFIFFILRVCGAFLFGAPIE